MKPTSQHQVDAARRDAHAEFRRKLIAALGMEPEPVYDHREKGVTQAERRRRAGEMYAYTTGELLRDLRIERPELASALELERDNARARLL